MESRPRTLDRDTVRQRVEAAGADLFGVADLARAAALETDPADLLQGFSRALVLGVKLSDAAVDGCVDGPTALYQHTYTQANQSLDAMTFDLARWLEGQGQRALPLPASLLLDRERLTSNISYKALGRLAGLGWQGKSLLLIHPEYGPRIRLGVVLSDVALAADAPLRNRCGSCTRCAEACPAGAIRDVGTDDHYAERDQALEFGRCAQQCLEVFTHWAHIEKPICGVCVRVCPWGTRGAKRKRR